jgi:predicted N-acetyltransferase YhbS
MDFRTLRLDDERALADSQQLMAACFLDATSTSVGFLRWMYAENPAGVALGSVAYENGGAVSQVCVVPQRMTRGRETFRAGLIVNVCTLPTQRGRGLLTENIRRAIEAARDLNFDLLYGFPNPASYGAFLKVGFRVPREFQLEMMPVRFARLLREYLRREKFETLASTTDLDVDTSAWKDFQPVNADEACAFETAHEDAARRSDDSSTSSTNASHDDGDETWTVPLTCDQLRWRFLSHPTRRYYALRHRASGALVILRFINLYGLSACVLMKTTCDTPRRFNLLMRDLRRACRGSVAFVTTFHSRLTPSRAVALARRRLVVPRSLAPRRFPVIFMPLGENVDARGARFELSVGDFDAI